MLRLAIDLDNRVQVPWLGANAVIPDLRQATIDVEIRFLRPSTGATYSGSPYETADVTAYLGARLGIWKKSTGTLADSGDNLLALTPHDQFTYIASESQDNAKYTGIVGAYPFFRGTFNTWTQEIADWIGKALNRRAYFSVALVRADTSLEAVLDQQGDTNCTLLAATDDGTGVQPVSVTSNPGQQTFNLPCSFYDPVTNRTWTWAYDATTNGPKLTEST